MMSNGDKLYVKESAKDGTEPNALVCDQDQQNKLQTELKGLKEKMNAAEREIIQENNNNITDEIATPSCNVCAKKMDIELKIIATQCGDGKMVENAKHIADDSNGNLIF